MARIAKIERPAGFSAVDAAAQSAGERNDCAVKALALITGVEYAEVHAALTAEGRRPGCRTHNQKTLAAAERIGFVLTPRTAGWDDEIIATYPGVHKALKNCTTHHPRRFAKAWADQPDMLLQTSGHILAFINHEVVDWSVNNTLRIIGALMCRPQTEAEREATTARIAAEAAEAAAADTAKVEAAEAAEALKATRAAEREALKTAREAAAALKADERAEKAQKAAEVKAEPAPVKAPKAKRAPKVSAPEAVAA